MLEAYLEQLELGYYEAQFAFEGLADEHVWKRPAPGVLSVGELAGHISYWEAVRLAANDGERPLPDGSHPQPDLEKCPVKSPLIYHRFSYFPGTLETPPSEEHRAMMAAQVWAEMQRIHQEGLIHFKSLNPDLNAAPEGWPAGYTYGHFLRYAAFHIAYHTGQMYSVRHLLGETPPDN